MPNYQKSKIYKLWSPSKNLVYYGSTCETLAQRLAKHKYEHKKYNKDNTRNYYSSFLVLDCEDYKIELLEDYECNNRQQLCKKEGEYIKNNECVNKIVAGRTEKEYYEDNKEKIREYKKEYQIINTDKIKEKKKQYNMINADKISEYNRQYRLEKKLEKE